MQNLTLPVIRKFFSAKQGVTAIECNHNGQVLTVFANGDVSENESLLCNVTINEVGDTFIAANDSKTMGADGKTPLFKKGETVKRLKQSVEFKSFAGNNTPAQFAQSAAAFGLNLQVVMSA